MSPGTGIDHEPSQLYGNDTQAAPVDTILAPRCCARDCTVDPPESFTVRAMAVELLLSMSFDDPEVRPLLQLEGLRQWRPGRTNGYTQLESAVDRLGFYDVDGTIIVGGYPR